MGNRLERGEGLIRVKRRATAERIFIGGEKLIGGGFKGGDGEIGRE